MTDVVVMSLEAWDGVWRRNQHLIWRLLNSDPELRVLFVEPAADPLHDLRSGRTPQWRRGVDDTAMPGRLWTLRPLKALPRRVDRRADERLGDQVRAAAVQLGMADPILWVNDPGAADLARDTGWPTLYDITDDWLSASRPAAELARVGEREAWLLREAAEVVACSPELVRRKSPQRPGDRSPIRLVRNAVDTAAYLRPHDRPADLPEGRVAMYVGTLHADRLDVPLVIDTARALDGHGTVVLVGPDALGAADRAALDAAGVVRLGPRPHDTVVAYLQHADVLLVPHLVDDFTDSLDPIKLYEYQAAGRPVVSTRVAGFRDEDDVAIATTSFEDFPDAVHILVTTGKTRSPSASVGVADWQSRAQSMSAVLDAARDVR